MFMFLDLAAETRSNAPVPQASPALFSEDVSVMITTPYAGGGRSSVLFPAQLSVNTNRSASRWTLFRSDRVVYRGSGSITNLQVPEGRYYRIIPEEIKGYFVRVSPSGPFSLYATQTQRVSIIYEQLTGTLTLQAPFPDEETVEIKLVSSELKTPLSVKLKAKGGKIFWTSPSLPVGTYEISYLLPNKYLPVSSEFITIEPKKVFKLNPHLVQGATLNITANTSEAIFLLREPASNKVWKGEGRTYAFRGIPAGAYVLSLATNEPDFFIPPPDIRVNLLEMEDKELQVTFQLQGKLIIDTNKEVSQIVVQGLGGRRQKYEQRVQGGQWSLSLPEGRYRVMAASGPEGKEDEFPLAPEPIDITVSPFKTVQVRMDFKTQTAAPVEKRQKTKNIDAQTQYLLQMAEVPAGPAIMGDASAQKPKIVMISDFSIGVYEITNEQFASWLTSASQVGKIVYVDEADRAGQVLDESGRLLFKTFTADPYSQIYSQSDSLKGRIYMPIVGKAAHPVINVSWYGAMAYCADNACRLPTEAEWEKAAGNHPQPQGQPLQKYRYGFSSDDIDKRWANYKVNDQPIVHFQVLTTPVGFYNGVNDLPLSVNTRVQQKTHLAKSPYGAFDMSGNVWEWVSDWFDDAYVKNMSDVDPTGPSTGSKKVVKGGCYDSLADGVRVTERMALPLDYTDAFTGFRIARSR